MIDWSNPLVVVGLGGFVISILGTITTSIVTIINTVRQVERKIDDAAATQAETRAELETIHEKTTATLANTDGNLHRLQEQLARADEREAVFKDMMSQLTTVLAAQRGAGVIVAPTAPIPSTPPRPGRATDKDPEGTP